MNRQPAFNVLEDVRVFPKKMQKKYNFSNFSLLLQNSKEDQQDFEGITNYVLDKLFDLDIDEEEQKIKQSLKVNQNTKKDQDLDVSKEEPNKGRKTSAKI